MIVKKLWRTVHLQTYIGTVRDYCGYFLFGFIPIYIVMLDKQWTNGYKDNEEFNYQHGVYRKFAHLLIKEKEI